MNYLTVLAVKNTRRHPVRSGLTITGIALSVAIILATLLINNVMKNSVEQMVAELGTGKTGIWIQEMTENDASIGSKQEGFPEQIGLQILKNPGISSVHPMLKVYSTIKLRDGISNEELYLYGIDFSSDKVVRNHVLIAGRYPTGRGEVLIGERFREKLNLKIGSRFTVPSPKGPLVLQVAGFLSGIKGSGTLNNNRIIFADLQNIQEYFGYQGLITNFNVVLKPGAKAVKVIGQLKKLLPDNTKAFTDPIMDAAGNDNSGALRITTVIMGLIAIFIAIFVIYNTLTSSVEQSRKELGLLRLIGMTQSQIAQYFIRQSLVYGITGSIIGVGLGIVFSWGLLYLVNNLIFQFRTFFLEMPSWSIVLFSMGIGIAVTCIVGLFPAIKAAKTSPLNVFREFDVETENDNKITLKNLSGLLFLAAGLAGRYLPVSPKPLLYLKFFSLLLILIGLLMLLDLILPFVLKTTAIVFGRFFGLPGKLALRSLELRIKRTVITVGTIMVSVAIFLGLLGQARSMQRTITEWYDSTRWADVLIFSISGAEIDESILQKIQGHYFVSKVNPLRYRFIPYIHRGLSDNGFLFQGMDPAAFENFRGLKINGRDSAAATKELTAGRAVLINENLGRVLGLKTGDFIKLETDSGMRDFKIAGTVSDYSDFIHRLGKIVYGSMDALRAFWGVKGYTVIQIHLAKGFSPVRAKKILLEELSGQYNIKVITHDEEKADVRASVDRVFAITYSLIVIIFIIVFTGIFNTILINVLFQIREFAVLRIVGCFTKQVRRIVICEALALGLLGGILASAAGFWLAEQMTIASTGIMGATIKYFMPAAVAGLLFLATIIISLLATVYPGRIATGVSISKVMQSIDEL